MTNVYVIVYDAYDARWIEAVFSKKQKIPPKYYGVEYNIVEVELDPK